MKPGDKLPGVRPMAKDLGVNRLTVLKAIRALSRAGLITTVRGKGVFVASRPHRPALRAHTLSEGPFFEGHAEGPGEDSADLQQLANGISSTVEDGLGDGVLTFSAGFPPPEMIPCDIIRTQIHKMLREPGAEMRLGYVSTEGAPELRRELRSVMAQRGLEIGDNDRILITGGAQQGITLCLDALLRPGASLALESPSYMGTIAACRLRGIPMTPVPVDSAGLNTRRLQSALRRHEVGAIYTVPNFQNPTGVVQGLRRRKKILDLAAAHNAFVIEDDIYADLRFGGRGIPPIKSLPGGDRVVYVGSFSKSLAPGFRVGFLVASGDLADDLRRLKEITDINTGALAQAVVADLLKRGYYRRHLVKVRREYRRRRDAMVAALEEHLPTTFRFSRPRGGMHLWVMPDHPLDAVKLLERARHAGVTFAPGILFFSDMRRSSSFRLNFSSHNPQNIEEGVRRLAECIKAEKEES